MNQRQTGILDLLKSNGEASIHDLARQFRVSEMTVRRDLTLLEKEEEITRTHGGAMLSRAGIIEFTFQEKGRISAREKKAIAREVANLIQPGMTITLDTGTTTLEVARLIAGYKPLTVLTSSLAIASVLYAHEHIELVLLGGMARKGNPDLTGWLTEENLKRFRVDLSALGADGVDSEGAFTTDMNIARVSQAMIAGANQTILMVDHTKFNKSAFVKFAAWNQIDYLVTDEGASAGVRKWLSHKIKKVVYAKVNE
jgi:DeoR family transcriptional regulator, fructose operon transcriptional repressor